LSERLRNPETKIKVIDKGGTSLAYGENSHPGLKAKKIKNTKFWHLTEAVSGAF
jgi:hypothetical protein